MQKAFPDYAVRRGFTSQIIIDHVNKRDGENDRQRNRGTGPRRGQQA